MIQVVSRTHTFIFPAGCHPAIQQDIRLDAGAPVPIPGEALSYALSHPGIEVHETAEAAITEPPAPPTPQPEED